MKNCNFQRICAQCAEIFPVSIPDDKPSCHISWQNGQNFESMREWGADIMMCIKKKLALSTRVVHRSKWKGRVNFSMNNDFNAHWKCIKLTIYCYLKWSSIGSLIRKSRHSLITVYYFRATPIATADYSLCLSCFSILGG